MQILLDSKYWFNEWQKTELELGELINGDLGIVKSAKTDEDTTTMHDIEKLISAKKQYIIYCKNRYQEELNLEEKKESIIKPITYFAREFGY